MTPVDLGQVAKKPSACSSLWRRRAKCKCRFRFQPGCPPSTATASGWPRRSITWPKCDQVSTTRGSVTLACRSAPEDILFEVTDTGIGIPPTSCRRCGRTLPSWPTRSRRGVEGLGLGLPLVRYVVRAHGGQVWRSRGREACSAFASRSAGRGMWP